MYGNDKKNTLTGTDLNDEIRGYGGNDTIKGGYGHDEIYGGGGNDKLYGGADNNTFYFSNGDGQDTIYLGNGNDTINFDKTVALNSLKYAKKGNNLIITYGTTNADGKDNTITISDYFKAKDLSTNSVNTIKIADKTITLSNIVISGKDGVWVDEFDNTEYYSKDFYGTDDGDFIYTNNNKVVNYINAKGGHDTIQIESAFTDAHGGAGDDTFIIKSLKNTAFIFDSEGDDTIVLSEKTKDVKILFDVVRKGKTPVLGYDTNEYNGLLVLNKSAYDKILKSGNLNIENGIYIEDYFNSNTIETFQTQDGVITSAALETVKQEVLGWLVKYEFNSAIDAFNLCSDDTAMQELINIYNSIS